MAPSAATAASRHRTSSWVRAIVARAVTACGHPPFGEEPGRAHHDERVGIREGIERAGRTGSSASPGPVPRGRRRWPAAARVPPPVRRARATSAHGEGAEAGQRAECGAWTSGSGSSRPAACDLDAARSDRLRSPGAGGGLRRGLWWRVPWQDHRSPNRVWPTCTTNASGEAEAIPTRPGPGAPRDVRRRRRWPLVLRDRACSSWRRWWSSAAGTSTTTPSPRAMPRPWRRSSRCRPSSTTRSPGTSSSPTSGQAAHRPDLPPGALLLVGQPGRPGGANCSGPQPRRTNWRRRASWR